MTLAIERTTEITNPLDAGGVVAVLAHPDDEFIIGGLLEAYRRRGTRVQAVVATDGTESDRGDPEQLQKGHRRHEGQLALSAYGILAPQQHFWGLPDGRLHTDDHLRTAARKLRELLAEYPGIDTIITLGAHGFDGHTDHGAMHNAAFAAAAQLSTSGRQLSLFGASRSETPIQISASPRLKLTNLAPHGSQFTVDLSDPHYIPEPGTVEQPGIRLSDRSRRDLGQYFLNLHLERYEHYPLPGTV